MWVDNVWIINTSPQGVTCIALRGSHVDCPLVSTIKHVIFANRGNSTKLICVYIGMHALLFFYVCSMIFIFDLGKSYSAAVASKIKTS